MDFYELTAKRYSVRAYQRRPVPEEVLGRILNAARLAPSAANRQPWRFVLVTEPGPLRAVCEAYPREWLADAPAIVVICGVTAEAWVRRDGVSYLQLDVGIAMDHLILAAAHEGVGSCWIAAFDAEKLGAALGLPPGVEPVIMTPLGYAADQAPAQKNRKPLDEILRRERW